MISRFELNALNAKLAKVFIDPLPPNATLDDLAQAEQRSNVICSNYVGRDFDTWMAADMALGEVRKKMNSSLLTPDEFCR